MNRPKPHIEPPNELPSDAYGAAYFERNDRRPMHPMHARFHANAIRSFWKHKRDFWQGIRLYEASASPHEKNWQLESLMSSYRMMKASVKHAREMMNG